MAGFRLTTKVQVSGWRFLLRRVEHAIVRRDTRMFDDPLQFYSRSVSAGLVVATLVVLGAAALAYFKPLGHRGGDTLLVDRTTNQLYVMLPGTDVLHPVYNLTSARLILASAGTPSAVKSAELELIPKGQSIGIPGAPYATPVTADASSDWALCDTVTNPASVLPTVQTSVIARPLALDAAISPMGPSQAQLVAYEGNKWVVTKHGRHLVDLADRAVVSSLGIPVTAKATPISRGMFDALPNVGPWTLPIIPTMGEPNTIGLPPQLPIGAVFQTLTESGPQHYVVLVDGVARVNTTTSAALRAINSFGLVTPPTIEPSVVARVLEREYRSPLPDGQLELLPRLDAPTLCWAWQRDAGDSAATITVLTGRHLPIPPEVRATGIPQIDGGATVYINGGKFVQLQSPDPRYGEALYYVDPQGVRYGLPDFDAAKNLGLAAPKRAPWAVVRLLVDGPVLSKDAALLEHDTLPADPKPRKIDVGAG